MSEETKQSQTSAKNAQVENTNTTQVKSVEDLKKELDKRLDELKQETAEQFNEAKQNKYGAWFFRAVEIVTCACVIYSVVSHIF